MPNEEISSTNNQRRERPANVEVKYDWKDHAKTLVYAAMALSVTLSAVIVASSGLFSSAVYYFGVDEILRASNFYGSYNGMSCLFTILTCAVGSMAFYKPVPNIRILHTYIAFLALTCALLCFWFGYSLLFDVACTLKLANYRTTNTAGCYDKAFGGTNYTAPSRFTSDDNYYMNLGLMIFEWFKIVIWLALSKYNLLFEVELNNVMVYCTVRFVVANYTVSFILIGYNWEEADIMFYVPDVVIDAISRKRKPEVSNN